MNGYSELTVRDHLKALGRDEQWMVSLTEMLIEFTGCDTAIASVRALDLSENRRFGQSVAAMMKGFLRICREMESAGNLSSNQRDTMRMLLRGMMEKLVPFFADG